MSLSFIESYWRHGVNIEVRFVMDLPRLKRHFKITICFAITLLTISAHGKQQFTAMIYDKFDHDKFSIQPLSSVNFGSENPFRDERIGDEHVSILGAGPSMAPDENGCFCFPPSDARSAYLRAFFFARKQIDFYNQFFTSLKMPTAKRIQISLELTPGKRSAGHASGSNFVSLGVSESVFDETILGHEVGHLVHFIVVPEHAGKNGYQKSLFTEGSANLLSALFFGTSRIGEAELFQVAYDVSQELRFPDQVVTVGQQCRTARQSEQFKARFPLAYQSCVEGIKKYREGDGSYYDQPYVYQTSSIFTEPLWAAAKRFGRDAVLKAYLPSLRKLYDIDNLQSLVKVMCSEIQRSDPDLGKFLRATYATRGLIVGE